MTHTLEKKKPFPRETVLKKCLGRIEELQKEADKTETAIREEILRTYQARRDKIPKILRWLRAKEPSWDKIHYDTPVNGAGWGMRDYISVHFEEPIGHLAKIADICERCDGQNIILTEEEIEILNLR